MENSENEHQLPRTVSLDTDTKDELHAFEADLVNYKAVQLKLQRQL